MLLRILKKDLKRKKIINIILLLFVILCSMFAAASVNNIIAVTGGLDYYFDKAGVPDVDVFSSGESDFEDRLNALSGVSEVKTEHYLTVLSSKNFKHNGEKLTNFINPANFISDGEMALNYFDEDNNIIKKVEKGTFYATTPFTANTDIKEGDMIELTVGECSLTLKYMGYFKGAVFSTETNAGPYMILNSDDYDNLKKDDAVSKKSTQFYVSTSDVRAVQKLAEEYGSIAVYTREEEKIIYFYDMLGAYILLAISIVLMITVFVVLRFTIGFTMSEEFREIGVMKAVGIGNGSIRSLYISKYLAISVIGAAVGFIGSIPLQKMMMMTVSQNIVLGSDNGFTMGLVSCLAVVAIILLFCYSCTRRVNKLSPIDAVRSGQTGERFKKKSILHLGKSKLPSTPFMAVNDVLSAPKQFGIITVIFTLCLLIVTMMSSFALTLKSEKIAWTFGIPDSDVHILEAEIIDDLFKGDKIAYKTLISDINDTLEKENMPGEVTVSYGEMCKSSCRDKTATILYWVTKGETDSKPHIDEGSTPQKADEIALTGYAMDDLGAEIGDRITAEIDGVEYEFIITGKFSTFEGNGHAAALYKDFELANPNSSCGVQIHFNDSPDKETIKKRVDRLKTIYDTDKIYNTSDMISSFTGMSDTLDAIKKMMMILTAVIAATIVVLMERSFISKEKSEIALMKAVGIQNSSIIGQHTIRFVIVSVLACIISSIVLLPISNALMDYICSMVGDVSGIKCAVDAAETFVICPAILIGVTALGSSLTALCTKTIKASDTASIE